MKSVDVKGDKWTYGAEHELSDWVGELPKTGHVIGRSDDHTLVNTNGIAVQPNVRIYPYGGELNTLPTRTIRDQAHILQEIVEWFGSNKNRRQVSINYRSNLHIHIHVPGLKHSLTRLKQLQEYIHSELPKFIDLIEPIPEGNTPAEKKRARRRRVSHHTFLTPKRLERQLASKTIQEFFEREVPKSNNGQIMWHAQPRVCVNLRQLLQTNTIEFRHFPGTLDHKELFKAIKWCREFLLRAFSGEGLSLQSEFVPHIRFPPFNEEQEIKYQATASRIGLTQSVVKKNIELILKGRFHGTEAEQEARERAGCLPRKHL